MERPFEVAERRTSVFASKGNPGEAWAGTFLQARQSFLEGALSQETDHLSAGVQPDRALIVAHPTGGHEDHLGPLHIKLRQRIVGRPSPQLPRFLGRQIDAERADPGHVRNLHAVRIQDAIRKRIHQYARAGLPGPQSIGIDGLSIRSRTVLPHRCQRSDAGSAELVP